MKLFPHSLKAPWKLRSQLDCSVGLVIQRKERPTVVDRIGAADMGTVCHTSNVDWRI